MKDISINELNKETVLDWLDFKGDHTIQDRLELEEDIKNNTSIKRYIAKIYGEYSARFSLSTDKETLTFWWPTYKPDISNKIVHTINKSIIKFILCEFENSKFKLIECKLKTSNEHINNWHRCAIDNGLLSLSNKKEYHLHLDLNIKWSDSNPIANITFIDEYSDAEIDRRLYSKIALTSPDEADKYEVKNGVHLSGFNHLTTILKNNTPIGFIAYNIDQERKTFWTNYIGFLKEWRNMGLGEYTLSRSINKAFNLGITDFYSLIDDQNSASIKTHDKIGYKPGNQTISCLLLGK